MNIKQTNPITGTLSNIFSKIDAKTQNVPLFEFGLYIILFIFFTILTATLLLIAHIAISPVSLIGGFVLSTIAMYCLGIRDLKKLVLLFLGLLLVFLISIGISGILYDPSWDGEAYHKPAVGWMELGWNPVYETTSEAIERLQIQSIIPSGNIIADVYAKATWIFAASCYAVFGDIESGKCYTLLGMLALFCISTSFLREKAKLQWWQAGICGFFLSANMVNLSQMFTYYNDGFLGTLVLIYIACFLYLSYGDKHKHTTAVYALIFATACIGMNVKFSGLMYFGIFGALFYFFWIFKWVKSDGWKNSFKRIRNLSIFFTILVLCSCLLVGSTVYIPNTINHENPVYGLIGDTNIAGIDVQMPVVLQNMPAELRFVTSMFLPTSNNKMMDTVDLKLPFTFSIAEASASAGCDCRIAGWGIMFSGIFILGLLSMIVTFAMTWKKKDEVFQLTLLIFLGVLLPSIFLTGMWWARYNSLPFLIQGFLLVFLFVLANKFNIDGNKKKRGQKMVLNKVLTVCLIAVLFISLLNIAPGIYTIPGKFQSSIQSSETLDKLAVLSEGQNVYVSVKDGDYTFYGRVFDLMDKNIDYTLVPIIEKPDGTIFSGCGTGRYYLS